MIHKTFYHITLLLLIFFSLFSLFSMNTSSAQNCDFNDHRSSPQPDRINEFHILPLSDNDDIPVFIPRCHREQTTNAPTQHRPTRDSLPSITQDIIQSNEMTFTSDYHFNFDEFRKDILVFCDNILKYNESMSKIEGDSLFKVKQKKFGDALAYNVGDPLMLLLEEKEERILVRQFIDIIDRPTEWLNCDEFKFNIPSDNDIEVICKSLELGYDDDAISQAKQYYHNVIYKPLRRDMNMFCDKATEIKYKYLDYFIPFFKKA